VSVVLAGETSLSMELEEAWSAWDRQSANVDRVLAYESAARAAARELGITTTHLRARLALARQSGTPYSVAVERLGLSS
jgi:hypothetical protein